MVFLPYEIFVTENDEGEQNAVHRIIYAITKHFITDPRILQERSSEILQNIRCRTLSDFRI